MGRNQTQPQRTGQDNLNMQEIKPLLRKYSLHSTKAQKAYSGLSHNNFYAKRATTSFPNSDSQKKIKIQPESPQTVHIHLPGIRH